MELKKQRSRPRTQKNPRPRPRTDFLRTDPLEVKAKDQGHIFSKLWSAKFPLPLSAKVFKILHVDNFFMINFRQGFRRSPKNKKGQRKEPPIFREVAGILQKKKGQRLVGFKAKDLSFEAKDFKMYSRGRLRGQVRPRRFHLWLLQSPNSLFLWYRYSSKQKILVGRAITLLY